MVGGEVEPGQVGRLGCVASRSRGEGGQLRDRVGDPAAAVGREAAAHAGDVLAVPGDATSAPGGGSRRAEHAATRSGDWRGGAAATRDEHVEQAVLLLALAVDGVGAAHRVVQPAGQLERQAALRPRDEEGRELLLVGPVPGRGWRRCGTSRPPGRRRRPRRQSSRARSWSGPRGTSSDERHVASTSGRSRSRHSGVQPSSTAGDLDLAVRVQQVRGVGDRVQWGAGPGDEADAQRVGAWRQRAPSTSPRAGGGDEQRADQGGIPARAVDAVLAHRLGQRGQAGREDRRVVDRVRQTGPDPQARAQRLRRRCHAGRLLGWRWADPPT